MAAKKNATIVKHDRNITDSTFLVWLGKKQELFRLESLRMSSELSLGHRMDRLGSCMCQGINAEGTEKK